MAKKKKKVTKKASRTGAAKSSKKAKSISSASKKGSKKAAKSSTRKTKKSTGSKKVTARKKKTGKKKAAKKVAKKNGTKKKAAGKKVTKKKKAATKKTAKSTGRNGKTATRSSRSTRSGSSSRRGSTAAQSYVPPSLLDFDPNGEELTPQQLKKVKTGLKAKDYRYFLALLLERRAEILGDVEGMEAARQAAIGDDHSHMPLHMADVGSDNFEQELTLGLMASERRMISEIDQAITRIQDKTYGVCLLTGRPINRARLEAQPWAKYCIDVARERERRGLA